MAKKKTNSALSILKTALKRIEMLDPADCAYDEDDRVAYEGAEKMKENALAVIECLIDCEKM